MYAVPLASQDAIETKLVKDSRRKDEHNVQPVLLSACPEMIADASSSWSLFRFHADPRLPAS